MNGYITVTVPDTGFVFFHFFSDFYSENISILKLNFILPLFHVI
jgi:hypothetical protein